MPKYRWAILKYPDGHKARIIVLEQEVYADLMTLRRNYGISYRVGPRCDHDMAPALAAVERQRLFKVRKATPSRPLSVDLGRGSGGPV